MTEPQPKPAGSLERIRLVRSERLRDVPLRELTSEVLARVHEGNGFARDPDLVRLGNDLQSALDAHLDVHANRYSRQRYADIFQSLYASIGPVKPPLAGSTWVDLGCGSVNPGGLLFMFLMLGVRSGICVDLDDVQDVPRAVKALAECAALMLLDPRSLLGDHPITPQQVLENIASFDLAKLRAGELSGVDADRLRFLRESAYSLSIDPGSVDVTTSIAFLEHLPRIDAVLAELSRVTRRGGLGIHVIDCTDHMRYWKPETPPLAFRSVEPGAELVHDSNRIRPTEFVGLFERHGFEVLSCTPFEQTPVDEALRRSFLEPWRSMRLEDLRVSQARVVVRKR